MKKTTSWSRNNLKVQSDSGEMFGLVIVDTCCLCMAAISVWITVSHFGHTSLINDLKAVALSSFSMSEEEWTRLNFNWFVKQVSTCSLIFVLIGCLCPGEESSPENMLLHGPFSRKPKRIRTAFSPSQLLRLERAFEKNHYVVGAERKQLASGLCLTETQVGIMGNWRQGMLT